MGIIQSTINQAFRDFSVATIPASGAHEPIKSEVRALGLVIEGQVAAAALSGTDLDAAMELVTPLLTSAQAAQEAATETLGIANQALVLAQNVAASLPATVATQLGAAVADATADALVAAGQADQARSLAQLAASSTVANSRYYPTRSAGEAATVTGELFSTKDVGGNLVFYERTSGGSTLVSPGAYATLDGTQTLAGKTFAGGTKFATNGSRIGITDAAVPIVPQALLEMTNTGSTTNGLRVSSYWVGATGSPYQNNDNSLWETFNEIVSDSENYSWSISAPNAYNDIPAGVHDSGERVGVYGWATSVNIPGQYVHAGRLRSQIGVSGAAGFQGDTNPSPNTARIDSAIGVKGFIRGDSAGAEIETARAGEFISIDLATTIQNNAAVYAAANGGVETNFSFFGAQGWLFNAAPVFVGSYTAAQAGAQVTVRAGVNAFEFGNADPAGFGSTIGATAASGRPFVALHAEAMPTGNNFRTRGRPGVVISSDGVGALIFSRVTNSNASNQTLTDSAFFAANGKLVLLENARLPSDPPASASAAGEVGEIAWDSGYFYVCVADDTWKRAALATW